MTANVQSWIAAALLLGAVLWRTTAAKAGPVYGPVYGPEPTITGKWVDPDAPRRIRALARPIEEAANWPGLGDYLASIAFLESRGNPRAGKDTGNLARGWFGMRPNSARLRDLGLTGDALKDERYAVALAAWYAHRLRPFASKNQRIDWMAIRRGWAYPSWVNDVGNPKEGQQRLASHMTSAIRRSGAPANLLSTPVFGPGYAWPGIEQVIALVGAR